MGRMSAAPSALALITKHDFARIAHRKRHSDCDHNGMVVVLLRQLDALVAQHRQRAGDATASGVRQSPRSSRATLAG